MFRCYDSILTRPVSSSLVISPEFVISCIAYARAHTQSTAYPASSAGSDLSYLGNSSDDAASSAPSDLPPYFVSKEEAMFYYAGISPTPPKLVYRTGSDARPFVMPKGLEAYCQLKQARGIFGHALNNVWKTSVGPKVCELLTTLNVAWTTIDGVRFLADKGEGESTLGPVVIWIGVRPGSLKGEDAYSAAHDILNLLHGVDIHDVEVEFRESLYHHYTGPVLLKSVSDLNNTVDVCGPLTTALGMSISAADRPTAQGTMTVFFAEGGKSNKMLGLTCHHVVLKVDADNNEDYTLRSAGAHRKNVQILGTRAFNALLDSIRLRIGRHAIMLEIHKADIEKLEKKLESEDEDDVEEANDGLAKVRTRLADANKAIEDLEKFFSTVKKDWGLASQRIIGHIRRCPPVAFNVQPGGYTEDWAAIELDGAKFKNFKGNFIDLGAFFFLCVFPSPFFVVVVTSSDALHTHMLGTEIASDIFTLKMYPRDDGRPSFKYPADRLLPLRDMITEELMRAPDMLDHDNEACLLVIKNGNATGVTIGRATGIESFVRDEDTGEVSLEWAIYNYDRKSGVFSAPGDSGTMVADGLGRMGGVLNGGAGKTESSDVTYITPMWWVWSRVKAEFPHANLYLTTV